MLVSHKTRGEARYGKRDLREGCVYMCVWRGKACYMKVERRVGRDTGKMLRVESNNHIKEYMEMP